MPVPRVRLVAICGVSAALLVVVVALLLLVRPQPAPAVDPAEVSGEALSAAVYASLQRGETETALALLAEGGERMPADPALLGIRGVVAALAGQNELARDLLENAVIWRQDNPLVNYNLGDLLVQSDKVADWIRGKWLLMEVMESGDADLVERAGLTLLANLRIPLLAEEALAIHERLDALSVFRRDNPRLSDEGRAAIARRMEPWSAATRRSFPER